MKELDEMYVYGAGGHGKVVAEILLAARLPLKGFVDDAAVNSQNSVLGLPESTIGPWLQRCRNRDQIGIALGIGDNRARQTVANHCRSWGFAIVIAIHPSAVISPSAVLHAGTVVMAAAAVNAEARIGIGAIINTGVVVEHDCVVGDYAHLSPNSALSGGVRVGSLSHVGVGAVVLPGITIGERTTIGAGAVVVCDIPDDMVAFGVPARVHSAAAG